MGGDKLTRAHICKKIFCAKKIGEGGGGLCKLSFSFFSTLLAYSWYQRIPKGEVVCANYPFLFFLHYSHTLDTKEYQKDQLLPLIPKANKDPNACILSMRFSLFSTIYPRLWNLMLEKILKFFAEIRWIVFLWTNYGRSFKIFNKKKNHKMGPHTWTCM